VPLVTLYIYIFMHNVINLIAADARTQAFFGRGEGPIFLDDVDCNGTEPQLFDCTYPGVGIHNCFHSEDAGVVCTGNTVEWIMV